MKTKVKISILIISIFFLIAIALYSFLPRFDVEASNSKIKETESKIKQNTNKDSKSKSDYVAKMSVKNKINDIYIFDNASESTLFNKGAGIEKSISSDFKENDYTFVKGHVETTFKDLDELVIGDTIEVTLKNGEILKYEVINIHEQKYLDNNNIYTYTDKVGLSISTCSKNSVNKQYPEKVLVVDAVLIN